MKLREKRRIIRLFLNGYGIAKIASLLWVQYGLTENDIEEALRNHMWSREFAPKERKP